MQTDDTKEEPPVRGILETLQGKIFKGQGYSCIFRPRSLNALDEAVPGDPDLESDLQLSLTVQTVTFSPIHKIPNRGLITQPDILLKGITYLNSVQDVTNEATGKADLQDGPSIHVEPGIWIAVPKAPESGLFNDMLARMASVPHGTTITAQGLQPSSTPCPGEPIFDPVDITPFLVVEGRRLPIRKFDSQILENKANRMPLDLTKFKAKGTITQDILDDPNQVLRNAIESQNITDCVKFDITTEPTDDFGGGGTTNIAFLSGIGAKDLRDTERCHPNALVSSVVATYWIETVEHRFTVERDNPQETYETPAGDFGPTFRILPTLGRCSDEHFTVRYTQLQYSQTILLDFFGLSWPHVTVGTLSEQATFYLTLAPETTETQSRE